MIHDLPRYAFDERRATADGHNVKREGHEHRHDRNARMAIVAQGHAALRCRYGRQCCLLTHAYLVAEGRIFYRLNRRFIFSDFFLGRQTAGLRHRFFLAGKTVVLRHRFFFAGRTSKKKYCIWLRKSQLTP
jgi:hypothetical protein